jgi:hypothetical protein
MTPSPYSVVYEEDRLCKGIYAHFFILGPAVRHSGGMTRCHAGGYEHLFILSFWHHGYPWRMTKCQNVIGLENRIFFSINIQLVMIFTSLARPLPITWQQYNKKEDLKMLTLWIVMGCMFMTGIGIRFTYKVLGLTPAEAVAVFVLVVTLVGVNTAPAKVFLMSLF